MSYLHIENLYKYPKILLFKQVYSLEKIHGTSAHISWKDGKVGYFSGGEKHEKFKALFFNEEDLVKRFKEHLSRNYIFKSVHTLLGTRMES